MCKQKTLTVAIASALIAGSGVVNAADQFQNGYVGMNPTIHDSSTTPSQPLGTFNFPLGTTLIRGEQNGVIYATELFGDGSSSVQLPSGTTSTVGAYAAVVYTVDGQINKNFDMTFTLTNGATFASAPMLSMDLSGVNPATMAADANATVRQDYAAGTTNIQIFPGDADNIPPASGVVQFSGSAQLYSFVGSGSSSTDNHLELTKLGDTAGLASGGIDGDPDLVSVFFLQPFAIANTLYLNDQANNYHSGAADNIGMRAGTAGLVKDQYYSVKGTGFTETEFKIDSISDAEGAKISATLTVNGMGPGDNVISRVYKLGDSNIVAARSEYPNANGPYLNPQTDSSSNNIFQFASHKDKYTLITGSGPGGDNVIIKPPLAQAIPTGDKLYQVRMRDSGEAVQGDWSTQIPIPIKSSTGSGKSTAVFEVNALTAAEGGYGVLETGTRLVLLYQINKADALADPGQEINMQVSLLSGVDKIVVGRAQEVTIATGKQAVDASMKAMDIGPIRISVDSGSTAFTGSTPGPYVSATTAKIGYIEINTESDVKMADGETDFKLGKTGAEASASTLDIEEGQFAASIGENGRVFINASSTIPASNVTETTAHWDLTNNDLNTIATTITDISAGKTTIQFTADGDTAINTGLENPPSATLKIDFDTATTEDITVTSELSQIKQDGTVCTLYNVPPSGAQDEVNIRITNESTSSDDLTCTLVDTAGATVLDAVPCFQDDLGASVPIGPMETKRLTSETLEALGATWGGRAVLTIRSSLPKMEVFGMLRSSIPGSPLTNLSYGAHGFSCEQ